MANFVAKALTGTNNAQNVFCYTFATPNNTQTADLTLTNIFNFCFTDDFVPQVPLAAWGYGKHGITYSVCADTLYQNNPTFAADMDAYVLRSKDRLNVTFAGLRTTALLTQVANEWESVQDYYNEQATPGIDQYETLYEFFHDLVAPAAMGGNSNYSLLMISEINGAKKYSLIASFFVIGSGASPDVYSNELLNDLFGDYVTENFIEDYIYNTHCAYTYYAAMKYGLFSTPTT